MGQNKQIEIIINSHEIALRDNISLYELLTSEKIKKIVDHKNPDENYKGNLLRNHLTKKRYPQLSKTYENHKKAVKDLKLEPEIKFDPPLNFENEKYSISFEFRDKEEYEKHIQKLFSINRNKIFDNLLK